MSDFLCAQYKAPVSHTDEHKPSYRAAAHLTRIIIFITIGTSENDMIESLRTILNVSQPLIETRR